MLSVVSRELDGSPKRLLAALMWTTVRLRDGRPCGRGVRLEMPLHGVVVAVAFRAARPCARERLLAGVGAHVLGELGRALEFARAADVGAFMSGLGSGDKVVEELGEVQIGVVAENGLC